VALLDDLQNVGKNLSECTISRLLKSLNAKEASAVIAAIDDPDTSPTSLARILNANGFPVSRQTINRHRNRGKKDSGCTCE
jgi:hypothetical protein